MLFEVAVLLALEFALVTVVPLHVDVVDLSFVDLEVAVRLAPVFPVFAQVTIEPLHGDAVVFLAENFGGAGGTGQSGLLSHSAASRHLLRSLLLLLLLLLLSLNFLLLLVPFLAPTT